MDSLLNLLYRALARASHRSFYVLMSKASEQHFASAFYGTTLLLHTTQIPKGSGNPPRLVLYLVNFGDCRFRWNRLSIEMASPGGRQQGNVQIRKYHVELLWIDNKLTSKFGLARNLLLLQLNRTRCTRCIMHAISAPAHKGITQIILEVIHHNHCSYIYLQKCVVYSQNRTPPSTSRIACHVECTTKLAILGVLLHRVHFLLHPFPMALGR